MDFTSVDIAAPATETDSQSATPITYEGLLRRGSAHLKEDGLSAQPIANMCSALRVWMRAHGFAESRRVEDDFDTGFDLLMLRFDDFLKESVGSRTRRDRQEQLLKWRRVLFGLKSVDTLPRGFKDALQVVMSARGMNIARLADKVDMPPTTLGNWVNGTVSPRGKTLAHLSTIERVLEVPAGTLLNRVPAGRRGAHLSRTAGKRIETSFTRRRRTQLSQGPYRLPFSGPIVQEWEALLRHKTDPSTAMSDEDSRNRRGTWRLKSIEDQAQRVEPWMLLDYAICATAGVHWGMFASFLGWLRLPRPVGAGLELDAASTLAWLADAERIKLYSRWLKARAGGVVNNGFKVFVDTVCSYLRPRTGFLWVRADLAARLAGCPEAPASLRACEDDSSAWRGACEQARATLRRYLQTELQGSKVRRTRDPRERPAAVLNTEWPLRELLRMVQRLESSPPPPAHQRDYCAWIRDVVMMRMLMSNPLRAETYAAMTYRKDNSGNLVRVGPGRFRLRFNPDDFKNEDGAASGPYDVEVHHSVGMWIERYLREARPNMPLADTTDRFFLPAALGPKVLARQHLEERGLREVHGYRAEGLSDRVKAVTARYIDSCPGFGTQAFRHIIATDHLRRNPGDYVSVANLLHDRLETVLKNYAHTGVQDGLNKLGASIDSATVELQATSHHG